MEFVKPTQKTNTEDTDVWLELQATEGPKQGPQCRPAGG